MSEPPKDPKGPTGLQRAIQMQEVPPEKWHQMLVRTLIGLLFVGLGLAGVFKLGWHPYLSVALVLFGATIWSTQVVKSTLMALLAPFKAWKRAVKGDTSGDTTGDEE